MIKIIRLNGSTSVVAAHQYQTVLKAILELLKKVHNVRLSLNSVIRFLTSNIIGFMQYG